MKSRRRVNSDVMWLQFQTMRILILYVLLVTVPVTALAQATRSRTQSRKTNSQTAATHRKTALTPRQIASLIFPSSVSIYVLGDDGDLYSGSGFIVAPGVVATCYHVVEDARRIIVTPMNGSKDRHVALLVRHDRDRDTALLLVRGLAGKPLKISRESDFYIGEPIFTIGNPKGLEGTFSNGIISNFHQIDDTYYMQFTAPTSPGSSGGPVVNNVGDVVGMVNMQIKEGQNLNFAIMSVHVQSLMDGTRDVPAGTYMDNNLGPPPRRKP
jgi:S1-C subfamily serine protease